MWHCAGWSFPNLKHRNKHEGPRFLLTGISLTSTSCFLWLLLVCLIGCKYATEFCLWFWTFLNTKFVAIKILLVWTGTTWMCIMNMIVTRPSVTVLPNDLITNEKSQSHLSSVSRVPPPGARWGNNREKLTITLCHMHNIYHQMYHVEPNATTNVQ